MRRGLAGAVLIAGCIEPRAFPCDADAECVLDGREGTCEAVGYCSYEDEECASGRRFEARAVGHEGECVEDEPAPGCDWASVHVGGFYACARDMGGTVYCWGANRDGELGIGPTDTAEFRPDPQPTDPPLVADAIATDGHTCAIANGLWCWGPNDAGQIDWNPSADPVRAPLQLDPMLDSIDAVVVGGTRTCVASGMLVRCWGGNLPGPPDPFFDVELPSPPVLAAAGIGHVCATLADGRVLCSGVNDRGQLGAAGTGTVILDLGGRPVAIDAGDHHTCVITEDAGGPTARLVSCWGDNAEYQAGSLSVDIVPTPTAVSGSVERSAWNDITTATAHSCALDAAGAIHYWGDNRWGRADPSPSAPWTGDAVPIAIDGREDVAAVDISAGTTSTCAVWEDGGLSCWGCLTPWVLLDGEDTDACPVDAGTVRHFECPPA